MNITQNHRFIGFLVVRNSQSQFYIGCAITFMVFVHIKLNKRSSSDSLIVPIKLKARENFLTDWILLFCVL